MASTYSPNLRLELIGTGEQQGSWGTTTNTNLGTLIEEAVGGYVSVTVSDVGDTTLTTANGATDQSRNMTLNLTGTISAARNVICPAIEKLYIVKNATTGGYAVTFKVSGQTGVSIPNGSVVFLYVDGTDARSVTGSIASQAASAVAITGGTINVGDAQSPRSDLQMTATTTPTAVVVGSISGTTLTVTSVASGTLAVGNRLTIAAAGLDYNTYITALGTGTGGTGTYTISQTATVGSTTINAYPSSYNTLTFYEKDTDVAANQPMGGIEWYGSDASTPGGGVKAYIAAVSESATPDSAMVFGTSDNSASTLAVERMRISSTGEVLVTSGSLSIGNADTTITRSAAGVIAVEGGNVPLENRANTFTNAQTINGGALSINNNTDYSPNVALTHAGATAGSAAYFITQRARGTYASPTIVSNGDQLGQLFFFGYDGSAYRQAGYIAATVDGTPGANDMPSRLTFGTTPDGGVSAVERMRITAAGDVGIGTSTSLGTYGKFRVGGAGYQALNVGSDDASGVEVIVAANAAVGARIGTLSNHPVDFYTNSVARMRIDSSGNILNTSSGGLGYGTGSGGTVTQATSKTTNVTLNKTNGKITMNNASLGAGASATFGLLN